MIETLWSLASIPLGIFCIFYGLLMDKGSTGSATLPTLDETQQDADKDETAFEEPRFTDPPVNRLMDEDVLYYKILMVGLGIGAILYGLDRFFPGTALLAKLGFLLTILLAIMIKIVRNKKAKENRREKPGKD